jgi:hypothetical protein
LFLLTAVQLKLEHVGIKALSLCENRESLPSLVAVVMHRNEGGIMRRIKWTLLPIAFLILAACGGPSEADIQATVAAAVQATAQAEQIAASVKATQDAERACGAIALNTYADTIEEEMQTFEMQTSVASSTPRVGLGTALQKMLDMQTETRRMEYPPCLKAYHERVVSMMGVYRYAYETFAAQGSETATQAALQVGGETLSELRAQLPMIREGQIPPEPTPVPTLTPGLATGIAN